MHSFIFHQIDWIIANTGDAAPLAQTKWLVIFNLNLECKEISRRFQRQPDSTVDWALLRWSDTAWVEHPSLDGKASWQSKMVIQKLFDPRSENTEPISELFNTLFDEVKIDII